MQQGAGERLIMATPKIHQSRTIAIKHGTEHNYKEAFANLDSGEVEDVNWDKGPSNKLYNGSGAAGKGSHPRHINKRKFKKNYDKIDWHREEDTNGGR